jgi:hypothetical protein
VEREVLVDIAGLPKAAVLKALHDGTHPVGFGILQARHDDAPLEEFQRRIDEDRRHCAVSRHRHLYFDYVFGRPIKSDISGDVLDPRLYDRDAGEGAAASAIARLRDRSSANVAEEARP